MTEAYNKTNAKALQGFWPKPSSQQWDEGAALPDWEVCERKCLFPHCLSGLKPP